MNEQTLTPPKNPEGYTDIELRSMMTLAQWDRFEHWIEEQSCGVDATTGERLVYPFDAERFFAMLRDQ